MFERSKATPRRRASDKLETPAVGVLPDHNAPHNRLSRVIAVVPAELDETPAVEQDERETALVRGATRSR